MPGQFTFGESFVQGLQFGKQLAQQRRAQENLFKLRQLQLAQTQESIALRQEQFEFAKQGALQAQENLEAESARELQILREQYSQRVPINIETGDVVSGITPPQFDVLGDLGVTEPASLVDQSRIRFVSLDEAETIRTRRLQGQAAELSLRASQDKLDRAEGDPEALKDAFNALNLGVTYTAEQVAALGPDGVQTVIRTVASIRNTDRRIAASQNGTESGAPTEPKPTARQREIEGLLETIRALPDNEQLIVIDDALKTTEMAHLRQALLVERLQIMKRIRDQGLIGQATERGDVTRQLREQEAQPEAIAPPTSVVISSRAEFDALNDGVPFVLNGVLYIKRDGHAIPVPSSEGLVRRQ